MTDSIPALVSVSETICRHLSCLSQSISRVVMNGLFAMAGCIHAATGPIKKESAWKVAKFGPVIAWSLNCDANAIQV